MKIEIDRFDFGFLAGALTVGSTYLQNLWSGVTMIPLWVSVVTILAGTILGLAIFVIALWGWNGIWAIPAKLYREKEDEADKYNWNRIIIEDRNIVDEPDFKIYGFEIRNTKSINLSIVVVEIIYLEIDGKVEYDSRRHNNVEYTRHRLPSFNQGNYDDGAFSMDKIDGKSQISFLICDGEKYLIPYCVPNAENRSGFDNKTIPFKKQVRCELFISIRIQNIPLEGKGNGAYCFEIKIDNNKPIVSFKSEHLPYYKDNENEKEN